MNSVILFWAVGTTHCMWIRIHWEKNLLISKLFSMATLKRRYESLKWEYNEKVKGSKDNYDSIHRWRGCSFCCIDILWWEIPYHWCQCRTDYEVSVEIRVIFLDSLIIVITGQIIPKIWRMFSAICGRCDQQNHTTTPQKQSENDTKHSRHHSSIFLISCKRIKTTCSIWIMNWKFSIAVRLIFSGWNF